MFWYIYKCLWWNTSKIGTISTYKSFFYHSNLLSCSCKSDSNGESSRSSSNYDYVI